MSHPLPIPDEWRDSHRVLHHLAGQCREWATRLREVDLDLEIVHGALTPGPTGSEPADGPVLSRLTDIHRELDQVVDQLINRATAYELVADALKKEASAP